MRGLARFGVSIEKDLLGKMDSLMEERGYTNRSEFIRDLVRDSLVRREWAAGARVAGAITLVYDHHHRELVNLLTGMQHDYQGLVVASQHVHLDHHNCFEVIAVRGDAKKIRELADRMRAAKGVKHGSLTIASTGAAL